MMGGVRGLPLCLGAIGACGPASQAPDAGFDSGFRLEAGGFDAGDPDACTARMPGDPGIVLGGGEVEWDEWADGDPVSFFHGPQDGYHFYGSVKEQSIDTSDVAIVAFAAFDGEDQINDGLGVYARPGTWVNLGDGWRTTVGYYVVLNVEDPEEVDGRSLCVILRVTDAAHAEFQDRRTITLSYAGDM